MPAMAPAESTAPGVEVDIASVLVPVAGSVVDVALAIRLVPVVVNEVVMLLVGAKPVRPPRRSLKKL